MSHETHPTASAEGAPEAPFLSVMLPVYNGEAYIADAIESVLRQPCRDLELIILNDGSTDGTLKIAQRYAGKDSRVRVQSHPNVGIGPNRNGGFPLVRGTCLIFLDDDDILMPNFYTERTRAWIADLFAHDIEMVVPARLYANEALDRAFLERVPREGVFPGAGPASLDLPYEFSTMIYRADVIRRNNIRFCDIFPEMESIFRHRCVFCSRKVLFTNSLWFLVRRDNPTQLTKTWQPEQVLRVRAQEYAKLYAWHVENGSHPAVVEEMQRRASDAQRELDTWQPPVKPSFWRRWQDARRARRDHEAWVATMPPLAEHLLRLDEDAAYTQPFPAAGDHGTPAGPRLAEVLEKLQPTVLLEAAREDGRAS